MKMLLNYLIALLLGIHITASAQKHKSPDLISGNEFHQDKQTLRKEQKIKRNKKKYSKNLFKDAIRKAKRSLKSIIVKRDIGKNSKGD